MSIGLEKFVRQHVRELKFLHRLRLELIELLTKIHLLNMNTSKNNLTSKIVMSTVNLLLNQGYNYLSDQMIHDLILYETYEYLELTSELGIHDKFCIAKVKDVDIYSMLMKKYKKPRISQENIEQFFSLNRNKIAW